MNIWKTANKQDSVAYDYLEKRAQAGSSTNAKLAQAKAWATFSASFPRADKSKFEAQVFFAPDNTATAEIFFKEGPDSLESVFGSDRKYWSAEMKRALGLVEVGGFPFQLTPRPEKSSLAVPAVPFEEAAPSLKKIFNKVIKIYVTPDQYFTTKFREIFTKEQPKFETSKPAKKWLAKPDMSFWEQQLNFAVWCATTGCGISREVFDKDSTLKLPPQVRAFYIFHVYFTVRRILFQLGGIQSFSALPGDPTWSQFNNKYDEASYKRLCAEFKVPSSTDFRFTIGPNHGLGSVYIYCRDPFILNVPYPSAKAKFDDEDPMATEKGISVCFIRNDAAEEQFNWFAPKTTTGLTQAGLSRINQSIEAFVYCILGAQVNVRSSILGAGGRAKEAQTEFLVLVEDAVRMPDLAKSVQRYQLAVDEAKVRLNLAVCPGAWLMPGRMVINTESTVGYNNQLKQAIPGMKLGVNDGANKRTKKAALQHMDGGKSKINPPNSHPSNPIHKAATAESKKDLKPVETPTTQESTQTTQVHTEERVPTAGSGSDSHDTNKVAMMVGAVAIAGLLFLTFR